MTTENTPWWKTPTPELSIEWIEKAQQHQNCLTKPQGSLGLLEQIAIKLCAIQKTLNPNVDQTGIYIFAADHGVVEEGVSAFPQAVTVEMLKNFVAGGAAISVLAKQINATLDVINMGTLEAGNALPGIIQRSQGAGTKNFAHEAAMSFNQFELAMACGKEMAEQAAQRQQTLFIGGEMGIGNTTSAAAMVAQLTNQPATHVTGKGTGLDDLGVSHKASVIDRALKAHSSNIKSPEDSLIYFGGFEIVALTGAYIRAAQLEIAVLVDGFICSAAALAATRINPSISNFLFYAHQSAEQGHAAVLSASNAEPLLDLGLRLGEGSGAAVAAPLLRLACALHNNMATFAQAEVSGKL